MLCCEGGAPCCCLIKPIQRYDVWVVIITVGTDGRAPSLLLGHPYGHLVEEVLLGGVIESSGLLMEGRRVIVLICHWLASLPESYIRHGSCSTRPLLLLLISFERRRSLSTFQIRCGNPLLILTQTVHWHSRSILVDPALPPLLLLIGLIITETLLHHHLLLLRVLLRVLLGQIAPTCVAGIISS